MMQNPIILDKGDEEISKLFGGFVTNELFDNLKCPDPKVSEYLTNLLVQQTRPHPNDVIRALNGKPIANPEVAIAEVLNREETIRRNLFTKVGDQTLVSAGFFQEGLKVTAGREFVTTSSEDSIRGVYWRAGEEAYARAAEIKPTREEDPSSELLMFLSHNIKGIAYTLGQVWRGILELSSANQRRGGFA